MSLWIWSTSLESRANTEQLHETVKHVSLQDEAVGRVTLMVVLLA